MFCLQQPNNVKGKFGLISLQPVALPFEVHSPIQNIISIITVLMLHVMFCGLAISFKSFVSCKLVFYCRRHKCLSVLLLEL